MRANHKQKTTVMYIRNVPEHVAKTIRMEAARRGMTLAEVITEAFTQHAAGKDDADA